MSEPAFPQAPCPKCGTDHEPHSSFDAGMSLRDYFAAKALQSIVADTGGDVDDDVASRRAYQLADAMLKAREAE